MTKHGRDHPLVGARRRRGQQAVEIDPCHRSLTDRRADSHTSGLHEPDKQYVRSFKPGDPSNAILRVVIVTGPASNLVEAVVSISAR